MEGGRESPIALLPFDCEGMAPPFHDILVSRKFQVLALDIHLSEEQTLLNTQASVDHSYVRVLCHGPLFSPVAPSPPEEEVLVGYSLLHPRGFDGYGTS